VLRLFAWVPRAACRVMAIGLLPIVFLAAFKERRQFFKNTEKILGLPKHSYFARIFSKQVARHQLHCQFETIKEIASPGSIVFEGETHLRDLLKKHYQAGRGVVVATAHLGSWELVGAKIAELSSRPFHVLAKPARFKLITRLLEDMRQTMGTVVLWTDQRTLLKRMLGLLQKDNAALGFVMDQKPANRQGPRVKFFGRKVAFVAGPATMAIRSGSGVIMVYCIRLAPWRYRLIAREIKEPSNAAHQCGVDELTSLMAADIEATIRGYPEQWAWSYRRWRFDDQEEVLL